MYFQSLLLLGGLGFVSAKVQFMGINIAGFEFGCAIDGTCPISSAQGPLTSLGGGDGAGQMQHFVTDDQMNIFRLPVSWQFLVNNKLAGTLDSTNFGKYDSLMQTCLATGAYCAIDLHNFARFNGQIIGQSSGSVTDAHFADIWTQLATKYKSNTKVIFGLMNEPHDLDVPTWAASCQAAVTAIRKTGASSQMILLPGTNFASAGQFVSSGSAAELIKLTNPDGSFDGLILDLHKYLDVDNSGTHTTCTTDNIADAFAIAADFLRTNGRKALVSETGAGKDSTCFTDFCAQNTFLNQNSDVFLGYIAWGAGSFSTSYILSLTPSKQNGKLVDNALASQCVIAPWLSAGSVTASAVVSSASRNPTTTLTQVSTSSKAVATATATAKVAVSITVKSVQSSSLVSSAKTTPVSTSWSNGTVASTATSEVVASSGSGASVTGTGSPIVATNGADMRSFAGGLLIGGFLVAVVL